MLPGGSHAQIQLVRTQLRLLVHIEHHRYCKGLHCAALSMLPAVTNTIGCDRQINPKVRGVSLGIGLDDMWDHTHHACCIQVHHESHCGQGRAHFAHTSGESSICRRRRPSLSIPYSPPNSTCANAAGFSVLFKDRR